MALLGMLVSACGQHQGPGQISQRRVPAAVVAARGARQAEAARQVWESGAPAKQILFGDLHVHTTFSADAFVMGLPIQQGEGAHPPADACDYARFCSALDFWSINDHAETITPRHWTEIKDSIRQCNAVAGDPKNPDTVAFLGWEWTQVGNVAAEHYGHKNVIFKDIEEERVPMRPINASTPQFDESMRRGLSLLDKLRLPLFDWDNRQLYYDLGLYQREVNGAQRCASGVDVHDLPADCMESAPTPEVLFEKLAQWGFESLVIPHGTSWGFYTPAGSTWDKQLVGKQHDPSRQTLIEVASGHGSSEQYRDWRAADVDPQGNPVCPAPTSSYEPCCWPAGEIIRQRCGDAPAAECERRVRDAQGNYLAAGLAGHLTVPGASSEDWKDCGQCRDCFLPAFNYRPTTSVQYALAISNFDDPSNPKRFRFGLIASSDNHRARPGTGFKEVARLAMTEASGGRDEAWHERISVPPETAAPRSRTSPNQDLYPWQLMETERQSSFFYAGGLVAVHAEGRDRDSIWSALKRREVYGTSGDRILLWFDLLNGPNGTAPMGSELELDAAPRFRVRAVGAFEQLSGCPETSVQGLSPERLERLCRGECFHPGEERRRITHIDVVRIRPQIAKGEALAPLIEDPWKRVACSGDPAGCLVEFDDPEFLTQNREVIYYVRAVQEPSPAVNANALRCEYDDNGQCVKVNPCWGDYRTPYDDDCLAPAAERAWSSPIYVGVATAAGDR